MAEHYLPRLPFFNVAMQRMGSVVGTPQNCVSLLEHDEAVMVFPEGQRGFIEPCHQAYELQEFGLGFLLLPVKFRVRFGEPLRFAGDPDDDNARIAQYVDAVKDRIRTPIAEGLEARDGWFR